MEKIVVSYTEQVQLFFDELIAQLFYKDYFIYEENAIEYVQKLVQYIDYSIENLPHKKVPKTLLNMAIFTFFTNQTKEQLGMFFFKKELKLFD